MHPQKKVLLIFVKNPQKGQVKTRLAESIGQENALQAYHKLTAYTRRVAEEVDADRQVWYSAFKPDQDAWPAKLFAKKLQQGTGLGDRMEEAFRQAFNEGYQKAVIIGSDCAELTAKDLDEAYKQLHCHDLVVGPSEDGGYYLLGMKAMYPQLFEDIAWSTPAVFEQTLEAARRLGLKAAFLPERNDVDYVEDWRSVKDRL